MIFENDYFLEDYIMIYCISEKIIEITYDTLIHQPLEKYLINKNIIIHGSFLKTKLFKN